MFQGGDSTNHNGTGGESIYGAKSGDENSADSTLPGILSMVAGERLPSLLIFQRLEAAASQPFLLPQMWLPSYHIPNAWRQLPPYHILTLEAAAPPHSATPDVPPLPLF
jgi:hypothetical protein